MPQATYQDLYWGTPRRIAQRPREYPFRFNGDVATYIYESTYAVDIGRFTPTAAGTVDPENAAAYLLEETKPEIQQGRIATFRRTYSTVPTTQTVRSSFVLSKPSLSGVFPQNFGPFVVFRPDSTLERYDAYLRKVVTFDTGAPSAFPTGGTYTLTFNGNTTTALAHNATDVTVQTALNALASVTARGGLSVTGAFNTVGLLITFNSYAQITNSGSFSYPNPGTANSINFLSNGGYVQSVGSSFVENLDALSVDTSALVNTGGLTSSGLVDSSSSARFLIGALTVGGCTITGGTYKLTVGVLTTAPIAYNATFADVQAALIAAGITYVLVTALPGTSDTSPLTTNALGDTIRASIQKISRPPSSGSFTLTAFGSTTGSIAHNASAATVQTALNALTPVSNRGGVTVSGLIENGFTIAFSNPAMTATSSLTPVGATITAASDPVGRTQAFTFSAAPALFRDVTAPNHAILPGKLLYLRAANGAYVGQLINYSVPDANTVRFPVQSGDPVFSLLGPISQIGYLTKANYEPGSRMVRCKRITSFFLPGVTPGITTPDDIALPTSESDSMSLLLAILAGIGEINYAVGELSQWRASSIYSLTTTTIRAADA